MFHARALLVALAVSGPPAAAQTFTDTFEGNQNQGGWTFGAPAQFIAPTGGNPGGYLRAPGLDTTIPFLHTTSAATTAAFIGNYRARNVTALAADVNVFQTDFPIGAFPLCAMLYSNNGTPGFFDDDWGAFLRGEAIPAPGGGWKHVSFGVPAGSTSLPTDWEFIQFGPSSPPNPDWNALITNVSNLFFTFGDPSLFYIFQMWTVGADNLSITEGAACYPDCNGDAALTVADFGCFQTAFVAGDPYADCNEDTFLTVADFGCFQTRFVAGCP